MVVGLLVVSAIPTTIGVCQALSAQKKADAAAKEKAKFNLTTTVSLDENGPVECHIVLKGGRIWIDHPAYPMPGHKFTGYYFMYPSEDQHLGMVSTIADDPPMLNWIFVDKDNNLLRHGARSETLGHTIGPWFWTNDEEWLTLDKDDSQFLAVLLPNDKWTIAWDRDGRIKESGDPFWGEGSSNSETDGDGEDEEGSDEESGGAGGTEVEKRQAPNQKGCTHSSRGGGGGGGEGLKWVPIRLYRQMMLGMKSKYVKGDGGAKQEG